MTIKINYKIYLITLTSVAALSYEPRVEKPIEMELLTKGVYTCVNTERDMTCFGGEVPTEWDGVSMPDASIVLHRVGQKARVVSEFAICTDRGECFGDPMVGIEAAKVVLQPLDYSRWKDVKGSLNFSCGLNHLGQVDCWGDEWGIVREDSDRLQDPKGKFDDFAINEWDFCGIQEGKLICQSMYSGAEYPIDAGGFTEPCVGFPFVCARHANDPSKLSCWDDYSDQGCSDTFHSPTPTVYENVKEYACSSGTRCINYGTTVTCIDYEKRAHTYELKLEQLSVGTQHFCGIDSTGKLVCRVFGDLSKHQEYRLMVPIPAVAWKELATPRPKFSDIIADKEDH